MEQDNNFLQQSQNNKRIHVDVWSRKTVKKRWFQNECQFDAHSNPLSQEVQQSNRFNDTGQPVNFVHFHSETVTAIGDRNWVVWRKLYVAANERVLCCAK